MEKMNKEILAKHVLAKAIVEACKGETDKRLTIDDAKKVLELLPQVIVDLVSTGSTVRIQGLVDFTPKEMAERKCRNPKSGEEITVEPTMLVKITKSRAFANKIKAIYAENN